jgi:aryl-alcohol dehydrogenase-like predicted oxidoreductase
MTPSPSFRQLTGRAVFPIGLGCMNLSHAYGVPPGAEQARDLLHAALDAGVTVFDTAALYGFGANETLIGPLLAPHRGRIVLCSKGGMAGVTRDGTTQRVIDGRPEAIRRNCEDSLRRLGTDHIDLYYLHRWDKSVPIEESVGAMARLKEEGKIGALGLSEVSAATLRRAHSVHAIAALQSEYSLWSRNAELGTLQACAELGVAYVAFSPLGRGMLTARPPQPEALLPKDIRRTMPRFQPENHARNLPLVQAHAALAREVGVTPAQLALAWLLSRGPHVLPLPGTTQLSHLADDLAAAPMNLDAATLARLDQLWQPAAVSGGRYNEQGSREVDTEAFGA